MGHPGQLMSKALASPAALDAELEAQGYTLGKSSDELPPPDAAHSVHDHDFAAYDEGESEEPPRSNSQRLAELCREAADDIRTLLGVCCVGDSPAAAEEFKAPYSAVLAELDAEEQRQLGTEASPKPHVDDLFLLVQEHAGKIRALFNARDYSKASQDKVYEETRAKLTEWGLADLLDWTPTN